jgi:hypothetical protein
MFLPEQNKLLTGDGLKVQECGVGYAAEAREVLAQPVILATFTLKSTPFSHLTIFLGQISEHATEEHSQR